MPGFMWEETGIATIHGLGLTLELEKLGKDHRTFASQVERRSVRGEG